MFSELVSGTVAEERERILQEFSLDDENSALARLVREVVARHGEVQDAMEKKLEDVVAEFSLDSDDSALSRLVARGVGAEAHHGRVLARRRGLRPGATAPRDVGAVGRRPDGRRRIPRARPDGTRGDVGARKEAARSTRHGVDFEESVCDFVQNASVLSGDVVTGVGHETGHIRKCKGGDIVVENGAGHVAAWARIVVEAKAQAGITVRDALAELGRARKNREAGVGLMVLAAGCAPENIDGFPRHGNDILVVWDPADASTNIRVSMALSLAKALSVQARLEREKVAADLSGIDAAVRAVEKQAQALDEICRWSKTIVNDGEKIQQRAAKMQRELLEQVEALDEQVEALKVTLAVTTDR